LPGTHEEFIAFIPTTLGYRVEIVQCATGLLGLPDATLVLAERQKQPGHNPPGRGQWYHFSAWGFRRLINEKCL
jgi:hypothetical protein